MAQAFERLERILRLEAEQGYKNKAVVGGIRQFATFWVSEARGEVTSDIDLFFVEQVGETLANYRKLSGIEARREAVGNILQRLEGRDSRSVPSSTAASVVRQPAKPQSKVTQQQVAAKQEVVTPKPVAERPSAKKQEQPKPVRQSVQKSADTPITELRGVGPKIGQLLAKLGVHTIRDLLYLHPRRYDDYTKMSPINRLSYGEIVTVIGTLWSIRTRRTRNNQTLIEAVVGDGTGKVQVTWFNQPWLANQLKGGTQIVLSGKVEQYLGRPRLNNPEWEPVLPEQLRTNRIVPVYPLTKGLGANKMRTLVKTAVDGYRRNIPDPLPETIRARQELFRLEDALLHIHFPRSQEFLHHARKRLMFDEMFLLQLGMLGHRRQWQERPATPLEAHEGERIRFFNALPFEPTDAQKRVVAEIAADMARAVPMNRLLQGDVGAGKTIVAAAAMIVAVKSGVQAALMAPTEILAEQHYAGLSALLEPLGIRVRLLTGGTSSAEKEHVYFEASTGGADIFIGTTALIQPNVNFYNLGFVVIDEQHRFGVDQRGALRDKGVDDTHPHLLVMTATPIPRSLALSVYGDLDVSILDEMPPGRQEIKTKWLRQVERERAYGFLRRQVQEGRQAYIIYPLVEESDKLDVKAAVAEHERLQKVIFPDLRLGLLHGRMKSAEKDTIMRTFKQGDLDILISTTVIEVGIDVPNSTVIIIDGANRFGLAQLHQLRGRVGRGQHKSYCLLISDSSNDTAVERLKALEDTNDGFQLAEKDLQLRGPGEFFGRRQSGIPELQLASLLDMALLSTAREEAQTIFEHDPDLQRPEHQHLHQRVQHFWEQAGDIS